MPVAYPSGPDPLVLYLIRHGETEWALSGRHTGRTDIALTENGEAQARLLVPALSAIRFAHVYTSPLQRARQTCTLAGLGPGAQIEPDLAEWDYGDYEGCSSTEIRAARPGWTVFRDGCPGGEDPGQVSDRADRLIARLQGLSGTIALFSHGQFSCSFAARWIGAPVSQGEHFMLETGAMGVLACNPSHRDIRVIAHWNTRSAR
jgi:broad specificity phosphatase PhoE